MPCGMPGTRLASPSPERVLVRLQRSGGLAGFTVRSEVDSAQLAPADRAHLERLLGAADLSSTPPPTRGADRFQYTVSVDTGDKTHKVQLSEDQMPESLRTLVDWLPQAKARAT